MSRADLGRQLEEIYNRSSGQGSVCMLQGPPGIGKTHTAHELMHLAVKGSCLLEGSAPPTGSSALMPVSEALARIPASVTAVDEVADFIDQLKTAVPSFGVFAAPLHLRRKRRLASTAVVGSESYSFLLMFDLLRRISAQSSVMLFLDDLQWFDASSAAFVGFLMQRLTEVPIFVMLAARREGALREPAASIEAAMMRVPAACRVVLEVPPLTPDEVRAHTESVLGGPLSCTDDAIQRLTLLSKGLPKYLDELVLGLRARGALKADHDLWHVTEDLSLLEPPGGLADLIRHRIADSGRANAASVNMLYVAAAMGTRIDVDLVARVVGCRRLDVVGTLERVRADTGLVQVNSDGSGSYVFDHDLTRSAILDGLGSMTRAVHLEIAEALEPSGEAPAEQIAYHFACGGNRPMASEWFRRAASRSLARGAFEHSWTCAKSADEVLAEIDIEPLDDRRMAAVVVGAEALLGAERYSEAAAQLRVRMPTEPRSRDAQTQYLLGRALARLGSAPDIHNAVLQLAAAETASRETGDAVLRTATLVELVHALDSAGEFSRSKRAFLSAMKCARVANDPSLMARVNRLGCMFWQPENAIDALTEGLALSTKHGLDRERALTENNLGTEWIYLHELTRAEGFLVSARGRLTKLGGFRSDVPLNNLAVLCGLRGDIPGAQELAAQAGRQCVAAHNRIFIDTNVAIFNACAGQLTDAEQALVRCVDTSDELGDHFYRDVTRLNLGRVKLLMGKGVEVRKLIDASPPRRFKSDDLLIQGQRAALLIEAAHQIGERPDASWVKASADLERTTKPQAWLYRLPWVYCDMQFWED